MSLGDLAKAIGWAVTRQALSKYEKGRMRPSLEVLALLEKALDIRPVESPLFLEPPAESERVSYLVSAENVNGARDVLEFRDSDEPARMARSTLFGGGKLSALVHRIGGSGAKSQEKTPAPARPAEFALASLADRRARYTRAWKSASGPDRIRFREGERLPAKSASALKHRIADHLERYLGLESLLGMTIVFENPVAGWPSGAVADADEAAAEIRRRWNLGTGPVVNLLGVLEERGIRVFETEGIEGFEGLSGMFGAVPFVAVNRGFSTDRIRFTAAHELGHVLGLFPGREGAESLCHRFAGAFLLPRAAVVKAFGGPQPGRGCKITMAGLAEIKATYGISIQAIMARARGLELASERQFRAFRETVRDRGWTVNEPVAYAGVERTTRFRGLVHYAVASGILDLEGAAEIAGMSAGRLKDEIGEVF